MKKFSIFWAWSLLLPIGLTLFLLPFDPLVGGRFLAVWVMGLLFVVPGDRRLVYWPFLALMLLSARVWWLNYPPHPVSFHDALLLLAGVVAAASVPLNRLMVLVRLSLLAVFPALLTVGDRPWAPNPIVGSNQGAYVLGFLFLLAVIWCWQERQLWSKLFVGVVASSAFMLMWQTGSRAALIASVVALVIVRLLESYRFGALRRDLCFAVGMAILLYCVRWWLFPSGTGLPGFDADSDLGRFWAAQCFLALPFSGQNRLLYGVGFDRIKDFCQEVPGGVALAHAHNLYLQIWAAAGFLGVLAFILIAIILFQKWRLAEASMPQPLRISGQALWIYVLLQSLFDLSMWHWATTLIFTGFLLGIPLACLQASTDSP